MSYRNDHDAALARIDALEAELGQSSEAKARFSNLESMLSAARAERDRARAQLENSTRRSLALPIALGCAAIAAFAGVGLAFRGEHETAPRAAMPAPPTEITREARIEQLVGCVKVLDKVVLHHEPSSPSCIAAIKQQANDLTLGDDIHAILGNWYAAETAAAIDPDQIAARDSLVDRVHAYVIPSYTR